MPEGSVPVVVTGTFNFDPSNGATLQLTVDDGGVTWPGPGAPTFTPVSLTCATTPCTWTWTYTPVEDVFATVTVTATRIAGVNPIRAQYATQVQDEFTVTITNVPPNASFEANGCPELGGINVSAPTGNGGVSPGACIKAEGDPLTLFLRNPVDPGALDNPPTGTFTYRFDCGDGVWRDGVVDPDPTKGASYDCGPVTADGGYLQLLGTDFGVKTLFVRGQICDDDGACTEITNVRRGSQPGANGRRPQDFSLYAGIVFVQNTPPSAAFKAPPNVIEGSPFTLQLTDVTDPAPADVAAGFEFELACYAGDGQSGKPIPAGRTRSSVRKIRSTAGERGWLPPDTSTATSASLTCTTVDGPEERVVGGRVADKDMAAYFRILDTSVLGFWREYLRRLVVLNAPPVVGAPVITSPASTAVTAKVTTSFSDPGVQDVHTCSIDWGDGAVVPGTVVEANGAGTCTGSHTYASTGRFAVRVTVADEDGGSQVAGAAFVVPEAANVRPVVAKPTFTGAGATTTPMSATFTDANTTDTHTCDIDWGDGAAEPGTVAEASGAGTCSGSHAFPGPGTYPVQVTVTDDKGASRSASANYVVPTPGGPTPVYQPDAQVRRGKANQLYVGDDVYNTGAAGQTLNATIARGTQRGFIVQVQNDGTALDTIRVWGFGRGHGIRVTYYQGKSGTVDITPQVTAGTYEFTDLQPGESAYLRMVIRPNPGAVAGATRGFKVTTTSQSDASKKDAIKVIATAR